MIRASRDQRPFDGSPELIAVFRALRRLLAPRHPPHALSSLAALFLSSGPRAGPFEQRPAGYPPEPSSEDSGKVTIQFSTSKARVEIARRFGRPLRERPSRRLMRLLSPPNCQRTTRTWPPTARPQGGCCDREHLDRGPEPVRPSVAIAGDVAIVRRCFVLAAGDAASTRTAIVFSCGDDGARTRDLLVANQALSRLSYVPSSPADFDPSGRTWIRTTDLSFIRAAL